MFYAYDDKSEKHSRSDDDEEDSLHDYSGKRVKLDSLLKNLSLKDQENEKRYIINPKSRTKIF